MSKLYVIGIDSRGLPQTATEAIGRSTCVFCTERFKGLLNDFHGEILPITPLAEALTLMAARLATGSITVLASGDPLFFGIGRSLIQHFGAEKVVIHPALSSMQLAFAHCKEPWEDAAFISLHGRGDIVILPLLLQKKKIFLLTDSRHRPEEIAGTIAAGLDGLDLSDLDCRIMVAENLGMNDERITHGNPVQIARQRFAELNVMIICLAPSVPFDSAQGTDGAGLSRSLRPPRSLNEVEGHNGKSLSHPPRSLSGAEGHGGDVGYRPEKVCQPLGPLGLTEYEIQHSRGLISKDEVRAAILHQLRLPSRGIFWDIGAGSGSVSIEAARLCPELTVYAIERQAEEQANILANRKRFRLANLHLIRGQAPDALGKLPAPDRVFIGGSGGQLAAVVEVISTQIKTNGIVMASAVTEATRNGAPRLFHEHGFTVAMTTIAVSRETYPPQADGPLTLNPITLITGSK